MQHYDNDKVFQRFERVFGEDKQAFIGLISHRPDLVDYIRNERPDVLARLLENDLPLFGKIVRGREVRDG